MPSLTIPRDEDNVVLTVEKKRPAPRTRKVFWAGWDDEGDQISTAPAWPRAAALPTRW
jgi:hypothetical protein